MASERDIFELSGPHHMPSVVNWHDCNHRRCVAASLVQGVYVLERDRQERRIESQALAEKWWSFFKFKMSQALVDGIDGSVFGAVYKWSKKAAGVQCRPPGAPRAVVAFRGTITKPHTFCRDVQLDVHLIRNGLHATSRYEVGLDAVRRNVCKYGGGEKVWMVGHSLGAAVGLLVGRKMVEEGGWCVEAHLFNPPFVAAPLERVRDPTLKRGLHMARSLVSAGLALTLKDAPARAHAHHSFSALQTWLPSLYVNSRDDICSGYIGYFDNLKVMHAIGAGGVANIAAQHSISDMLLSRFGYRDSKPVHLIPSAKLTVNLSPTPDFKTAHGIHQWWAPSINIQCTDCRLPT